MINSPYLLVRYGENRFPGIKIFGMWREWYGYKNRQS
jgi:hypothetical protein